MDRFLMGVLGGEFSHEGCARGSGFLVIGVLEGNFLEKGLEESKGIFSRDRR